MENMRQKIDIGLHPVGRPSQPRKGLVSEDLGRTQFTSGPTSKGFKSSWKQHDANLSESDDELDAFSSEHKSISFSSPSRKAKVPKKVNVLRKGKSVVTSASRLDHPILKVTKNVDVNEKNISTPSVRRPIPRPAFKKVEAFNLDEDMPPSNPLALESKRPRKISSGDDLRGMSPLEELSPNRAKRLKMSKTGKKKVGPAPFPMEVEHTVTSERPSRRSHPEPAPFPIDVPYAKSSVQKQKPAPFPLGSRPLQRQVPCFKTALSCNDDSDDDDLKITKNDGLLTYGGPRPFPMSVSQFPQEPASNSKRSKRDESENRAGMQNQSSPESNDLRRLSLDGEENVDPSTICPYCDEPWPRDPSPTLIALLERTKRKSYADPRHGNALGLKAPLAAFVELCQRHRFEMTHLPLALARRWPTRIDFASLPKRIGVLRKELRRVLDRPDQSTFWRELRDDAKEVGMAKIVSVTGQYATFERTQPGYYGEQGSIIIHQSLYTLFPPDSIPAQSVLPLTPDQFLTRVLVPETALLLIQQDMGLATKDEAMGVLDDSKQYGVAMFPEQAQDEEVAEVGERLARDRARAMRKVLEERGEADADVRREVEREKRQARKAKANEKESPKAPRKGKGKAKESDTDSELSQAREGHKVKDAVTRPARRRWEQNGDFRMHNTSDEPTPRPAKVDGNYRESSTTSWRSNRSPSSSPIALAVKRSSPPSLHEAIRAPASSPQSTRRAEVVTDGSQWSFKLHDGYSSGPDHGDDKTIETSNHVPPTDDSDSDVRVITDTETPKPRRPQVRKVVKNVAKNKVLSSEESGSEDKTRRQPTYKKQGRHVGEKENVKVKSFGTLGQTKRRKKGKAAGPSDSGGESSNHNWLLDDSSN